MQMPNSENKKTPAAPLLFQKRVSVSGGIAAQYVGTDTEMDPKEAFVKPIVSAASAGKA